MAASNQAEKKQRDQTAVYGEVTHDPNFRRTTNTVPAANDADLNTKPSISEAANDPIYKQRRKTADRTDLRSRTVTRNIRTSSMPGSASDGRTVSRPTVDARFRDDAYADKVLQPSTIEDRPNRQKYEQPKQLTRREQVEYADQEAPQGLVPRGAKTQKQRRALRKKMGADSASTLLRAKMVTFGIRSWALPLYLFVQLPFAITATIFMGMALAIQSFFAENVHQTADKSSWFSNVVGFFTGVIKTVVGALDAATEFLFGFSVSGLPAYAFGALWLFLMGYAIMLLFSIYMSYKLSFIEPLSGKSSGKKQRAFIITVVGYCTPLLFLFPWFWYWTRVVKKNPK